MIINITSLSIPFVIDILVVVSFIVSQQLIIIILEAGCTKFVHGGGGGGLSAQPACSSVRDPSHNSGLLELAWLPA